MSSVFSMLVADHSATVMGVGVDVLGGELCAPHPGHLSWRLQVLVLGGLGLRCLR